MNSVGIDSAFISSPYETKSVKDGYVHFFVDPSDLNQFSYYYFKNSIRSATVTKQIFVRNTLSAHYLCLSDTIAF